MKKMTKYIGVGLLSLGIIMSNALPASAASLASWNLYVTPAGSSTQKNVQLDYSSAGYNATITDKNGSSPLNTIVIKSYQYSNGGNSMANIIELSEKGNTGTFGAPKQNIGVITFNISLKMQSGYIARNEGIISRRK